MSIPPIPPFVPILLVAILLPFLSRRVGHALGIVVTAAVVPYVWLLPEGVLISGNLFGFSTIFLYIDAFSRLMGGIFAFIGSIGVIYSYASDADTVQTAFALSYVGTSIGAVFAGDWLTLVFFVELMAIGSTLLVWHYGGRAVRAGFRYALWHGIGGTLLLAAIVWQYVTVDSVLFSAADGIVGTVPQVLAVVGAGVMVGFIGLHTWLPDTYPRPHIAASVFLSVYTTKTGVYIMFRILPDGQLAVAYMGGGMAVFGALMALMQSDMRRLLSYHIQSQVGYMIAGIGIGTTLATAGAFGHVFNHILYKSLLFMTVGVVIFRTGEKSLKHVGGLARKMPVTALAFSIAALSIAGFPGFNGFVSKGMVLAAADYEELEVLWWLLILGGVGTFLSFIKLGYHVFFHGDYDGEIRDATTGQKIAMGIVAGLCVIFGIVPSALFSIIPAGSEIKYETFTLGHIGEGVVLAIAGIIGFTILHRPLQRVGRVPDVDDIYNPAVFYGTRAMVKGVTESFARVDRLVVHLTTRTQWLLDNPERGIRRIRAVVERSKGAEYPDETPKPGTLRAGIGQSIALIVAVLALMLFVLLFS